MRVLPLAVAIVTRIQGARRVVHEALKDGPKSVFHHAACLALAPEVVRSGGHVFRGLSALRRGRLLKCFSCGKRGATVGCGVKECPRSFHAPCALFRSGGCVDEGNGESSNVFYCSAHRNSGRTAGCRAARSAWRRWKGPVDATGEPLLAPDAQPTRAEARPAPRLRTSFRAARSSSRRGVAAAAPAVVHPLLGATRRAPLGVVLVFASGL